MLIKPLARLAGHSVCCQVLRFCSMLPCLLCTIIALGCSFLAGIVIIISKSDLPLAVCSYVIIGSTLSLAVMNDLFSWRPALRRFVCTVGPIMVICGTSLVVALTRLMDPDNSWQVVHHGIWIWSVANSLAFFFMRLAYAASSQEYHDMVRESKSSILVQQLLMPVFGCAMTAAVFAMAASFLAAQYWAGKNLVSEIVVNSLLFPLVKMALKALLTEGASSGTLDVQMMRIGLLISFGLPGNVSMSMVSTWESYVTSLFISTSLQLIARTLRVHFAVVYSTLDATSALRAFRSGDNGTVQPDALQVEGADVGSPNTHADDLEQANSPQEDQIGQSEEAEVQPTTMGFVGASASCSSSQGAHEPGHDNGSNTAFLPGVPACSLPSQEEEASNLQRALDGPEIAESIAEQDPAPVCPSEATSPSPESLPSSSPPPLTPPPPPPPVLGLRISLDFRHRTSVEDNPVKRIQNRIVASDLSEKFISVIGPVMAGFASALAQAGSHDMGSIMQNLPWKMLVARIFTNSLAQTFADALLSFICQVRYGIVPCTAVAFGTSMRSLFAIGVIATATCMTAAVLAAAFIIGKEL